MSQNKIIKIGEVAIISLLILTGCSRMNSVDQDRLSGKIVGKITTIDGAPVRNASVKMTSADFSPDQTNNVDSFLSTTTDGIGQYYFAIEKSGLYSISAEKNGLYSFQDSIYATEDKQIEAGTSTLKVPGSISGIARLNKPDDNRSIIILVLGTTTYCQPSDTSGAFVINNLAEGVYRLKLLSTLRGYNVLDTTIQVVEGKNTRIGVPLQMVRSDLPGVGPVKAEFNKAMQIVTLTWPPIDTPDVQGLYVFRNTTVAGKPHMILKKTTTQFIDDIPDTSVIGDSLSYIIVAYGANDKIGPVGPIQKIRINGGLSLIKTIPFDKYSIFLNGQFTNIVLDKNLDLFVSDYRKILKIDSSGNTVASYVDDSTAIGKLSLDKDGNCYFLNAKKNSLIRLSNKLEIQKSYPYTISPAVDIHTFDNRLMYISDAEQYQEDTTKIWIFNTELTIIDSNLFTIPGYTLQLLSIRPERLICAIWPYGVGGFENIIIANGSDLNNVQIIDLKLVPNQFEKLVADKISRCGESNFPKRNDREMLSLWCILENENMIFFDNHFNAYIVNQGMYLLNRFKCKKGMSDSPYSIAYNETGKLCYFGDRKEVRIYEFR